MYDRPNAIEYKKLHYLEKIMDKRIYEFLNNYKVFKNLTIAVIFYCLKFPVEYLLPKLKSLTIIYNNVWTPELVKYFFYLTSIAFIGQYLIYLLAEVNKDLINISDFCRNILNLNKYFSNIAFLSGIITNVFLIYLFFLNGISINENIFGLIIINQIFLYVTIGIINFEIFWFRIIKLIFD